MLVSCCGIVCAPPTVRSGVASTLVEPRLDDFAQGRAREPPRQANAERSFGVITDQPLAEREQGAGPVARRTVQQDGTVRGLQDRV